jgi:hypothetical protein
MVGRDRQTNGVSENSLNFNQFLYFFSLASTG